MKNKSNNQPNKYVIKQVNNQTNNIIYLKNGNIVNKFEFVYSYLEYST